MNVPNLNLPILTVIAAVAIILIGVFVVILSITRLNKKQNTVSTRLEEFVLNQDKPKGGSIIRRIMPREITGSFYNRTFKPFFQKVVNFFGRLAPSNAIQKYEHQLTIAGNPMGLHARAFYGMRILFMFLGILVAILLNYRDRSLNLIHLLLGALMIILLIYIPTGWLKSLAKQRQDEFRRNLPDALDMLSVCASAGLGFDQSLKKISENWQTPLGIEIAHVIQEMEIGVSRSDALRNMAARLDVEEISSFVAIIIQAEGIGMSFAEVLHSQAKQMRILRQYRAKEIANKMPAKMIVPLAIFIFPALIAVILAPMIPTLMNLFV